MSDAMLKRVDRHALQRSWRECEDARNARDIDDDFRSRNGKAVWNRERSGERNRVETGSDKIQTGLQTLDDEWHRNARWVAVERSRVRIIGIGLRSVFKCIGEAIAIAIDTDADGWGGDGDRERGAG